MDTSKHKNYNTILAIIFFGSSWGILEAILGWSLHFIKFQAVGSIIFPLAMIILVAAYQLCKSKTAILFITLIAALFKLLNLGMPGDIERVIVPISCIIVEGIVCSILIPALKIEIKQIEFVKIEHSNTKNILTYATLGLAIIINIFV